MGKIQKSVGDLEKLHQESTGATFMLPSTQRGHDKVLKSQLFVEKFVEQEQYIFLDYISSGFELNFMVAVDFTASNGNPRNPNSLHYIDPSGKLNSYQQAITKLGRGRSYKFMILIDAFLHGDLEGRHLMALYHIVLT